MRQGRGFVGALLVLGVGGSAGSIRSAWIPPLSGIQRMCNQPGRCLTMRGNDAGGARHREMLQVQGSGRRRRYPTPPPLQVSQLPVDSSTIESSSSSSSSSSREDEMLEGGALGGQTAMIIALCFMCMVICSLDRVAMSVALLPMSYEFGLTETNKGAISSVFSLGYMTTMCPAGVLATAWSPKAVLAGGVAIWSLAQILSPEAAHLSLPLLLVCRFAMGMAESVATPTVQTIVGRWVDIKWRSRVVSLLTSGLNLGVLAAYLVSPHIIESSSWEDLFRVYGSLGLLWLMLWVPLASDSPQEAALGVSLPPGMKASPTGAITTTTRRRVRDDGEEEEEEEAPLAGLARKGMEFFTAVPWGQFVRSKELWAVTAAHSAHNYGLYVALAWLPSFFASEYHLDLSHSSASSVLPWLAAAVMTNVAGWSADLLINSGRVEKTVVRKMFQCTALMVPAACMWSLAHGVHSPTEAQALFTVSIAAGSLSSAGFGTATQDLAKKYVGITYGATSALSVVVGSIGTYVTGLILDHEHSWEMVFTSASAVYVLGAVAFASMYRARRIFD